MTTDSLVPCSVALKGTGLYSCGGKVGKHLRIQQTKKEFLNIGEMRAYSYKPIDYTEVTVSYSTLSSCAVSTVSLAKWPLGASGNPITQINKYSDCIQSVAGGPAAFN